LNGLSALSSINLRPISDQSAINLAQYAFNLCFSYAMECVVDWDALSSWISNKNPKCKLSNPNILSQSGNADPHILLQVGLTLAEALLFVLPPCSLLVALVEDLPDTVTALFSSTAQGNRLPRCHRPTKSEEKEHTPISRKLVPNLHCHSHLSVQGPWVEGCMSDLVACKVAVEAFQKKGVALLVLRPAPFVQPQPLKAAVLQQKLLLQTLTSLGSLPCLRPRRGAREAVAARRAEPALPSGLEPRILVLVAASMAVGHIALQQLLLTSPLTAQAVGLQTIV
jgi:hypothetical protein